MFGSFYLRVGAVAFGIGSMVYSGLEFGQYFELKGESDGDSTLAAIGNVPFYQLYRRRKLSECVDCIDTGRTNDLVHRSDAVHFPEHQGIRNETTQGHCTIWTDAYARHKSVRMAVRFGGRNQTRNSQFG